MSIATLSTAASSSASRLRRLLAMDRPTRDSAIDSPPEKLAARRSLRAGSDAIAHAAQLPRSLLSQAADNATRSRLAAANPSLAEAYQRTLRESTAYRAPSHHARLLLLLLIACLFWYAWHYHSEAFPDLHPDEWHDAFLQDGESNMYGYQ